MRIVRKPTHQLTALLTQVITKVHDRLAAETGAQALFSLNGEPVFAGDVASPSVLLPFFLWHADRIHQYSAGRPLGVLYRDAEHAFLGMIADVDGRIESNTEMLLYTIESFVDIYQSLPKKVVVLGNAEVETSCLDSLYCEFDKAMRAQATFLGSAPTSFPSSTSFVTANR